VEGGALLIVGVLPATFHFPLRAEVWFPVPWENTSRDAGNYRAVALLKPGVSVEAARTHLAAVGTSLQQSFPSHKYKSFTATPLKDLFVERSRMTLWLLMGTVGLVLLVACVNVANLLLARATARTREMALRAALGAGRQRLVGQLLIESVLLGLLGGACGLVLAFLGVSALVRLAPPNLPRLDEIRVDRMTLLFNLAVSLGASVLFGLWPALRAARVDLHDALKQGGARGVLGGGRGEWVRRALVSAEVALALVLTLGAALLFRSFLNLNAVDLGYHTEGRLVLTASVPEKIAIDAGAGPAPAARGHHLRTHLHRTSRTAGCERRSRRDGIAERALRLGWTIRGGRHARVHEQPIRKAPACRLPAYQPWIFRRDGCSLARAATSMSATSTVPSPS
jgi:hypothetical protein